VASAVDVVTRAFESERYGGVAPRDDRFTRANDAVTAIVERD